MRNTCNDRRIDQIFKGVLPPVPCAPCWLHVSHPYGRKFWEAMTADGVAPAVIQVWRGGVSVDGRPTWGRRPRTTDY